ncbi:MAG: ferredoxin:thioredoxin reductase [Spirochaetia bacterium]|nr:ferredoxin:thioredoxin reductase [Spirochaetia bacterium]
MKEKLTLKDVQTFTANTAAANGWVLNPDEEFLDSIQQGLLANAQRLGYYQCPCRDSWDDREKDRDIICPCEYSKPDIEEYGQCFCGLFLSDEFEESGSEASSIPERRPQELYP